MHASDLDPRVIHQLQQAALAGQPASRLLAIVQSELAARGETARSMDGSSYLRESFDWGIGQSMALGAWHGFNDIAAAWTDEMIDTRYEPLLEAWRQNQSPPVTAEDAWR